MNKKFMVVALMAALSTVGYAFEYTGNGTVSEGEHKGESHISGIFNKDQHIGLIDGHFNQVKDEMNKVEDKLNELDHKSDFNDDQLNAKIDREIADVESALADKVSKDELGNALAGKVDQSALDEVKNQGIANAGAINELSGKVDGHAGRLDSLEGQMSETLGNIAGIDWDNKQQQEQLNKHEEALANKADKGEINDLHAKVEAVEKENERVNAEQDKVIANKADKNYVDAENKKQDEVIKDHGDRLTGLEGKFAGYDGRLSGLEKKVDHLDDKMNKGLSLMAAMNAVDFQNVQTGEMALGAGIGHYGNAQSVALGVAYAPVEDLTVNAKYSITAGDPDSFAVGAGATYKFKVGR